jgi:hypothetical protein
MSKSLLEQVPDRMLFALVKKVYDSVSNHSSMEEVDEACQNYLKVMGITIIEYVDVTYVMELIKLNREDFEGGEMTQPLRRPTLNNYRFPYSIYEEQTTRTDYELELESYSSDKKDIVELKDFMAMIGDIDEFDSEPINKTEVVDGNYIETKWFKNEIYKVNQRSI